MNIAVILAGGSGSRLGRDCPKQFLKVAGKLIIEHTIDVFEHHNRVDEIAVVCKEEYIQQIESLILKNKYTKLHKVLVGGKERYHSSLSAIAAYQNDDDNLIFHDAVRPLVTARIIDDCLDAMSHYRAIDVAIKTTDTIIAVDSNSTILNIPNRALLYNGQTPQCFKRGVIRKAYEIALQDPNFSTTDDCGVVKKYLPEEPIYVVAGETFNMKVTYAEDLFLLDKLFQLKSIKENDSQPNELIKGKLASKVMVIFGGSYGIGKEVADLASELGCIVHSFSRSLNDVDVTRQESVNLALKDVHATHGKIDYVVCTAGVLIRQPLYNMSYDQISLSVATNYIGCVNVAKESMPYLSKSHGALLFYTSSSYTRGRMMYSIYSSTKAAIVNLTQALSEEWANEKIRVNCINPERCDTPMRRSNFGLEPKETLLDPKQVAAVSIKTLCSNLTGEVIDVKIENQ